MGEKAEEKEEEKPLTVIQSKENVEKRQKSSDSKGHALERMTVQRKC